MQQRHYLFIVLTFLLFSCDSNTSSTTKQGEATKEINPPAEGFNIEASDEKAIAIADTVMAKMGGRKNWDNTRYIQWTFFGRRNLLWDKWENRVRISMHGDSTIYVLNMDNMIGQVKKDGQRLTNRDSISKYLAEAKSIWINDSYWLVMPFKLKDSGVTLKYIGQNTTEDNQMADILELSFDNVGDTPQNKYWVYVNIASKRVTQWDFFTNATDTAPRFSTPWKDYKKYGNILLSGDRGRAQLTDIAVYEALPDSVFQTLQRIIIN